MNKITVLQTPLKLLKQKWVALLLELIARIYCYKRVDHFQLGKRIES